MILTHIDMLTKFAEVEEERPEEKNKESKKRDKKLKKKLARKVMDERLSQIRKEFLHMQQMDDTL